MLTWLLLVAATAAPDVLPTADEPGVVMPPRWWDVTHLHLAVTIDIENGAVRGKTTHRIQPLAVHHRAVRLHQVGLDILGVRVDGQPTSWSLGDEFIQFPVSPGEPHEVEISYEAHPQTGLHFRRPGRSARVLEAWSQGEGEDHRHWFPSWDYPNDRFTISTDITVPNGLTAVANGELIASKPAGEGWTTWSYALEQEVVNYLVAVAAGEYQVRELPNADVPMEVIAAKGLDMDQVLPGLDEAPAMLTWFNDLLGTDYPYPIYRQIGVQGFLYGGMENASFTVLSDQLLLTRPTARARRAESVVAHELAHQWFGDLLTCYGWRELWLNEGFATHWTNRWMDHHYGKAYAAFRRRGSYASAVRQSHPTAVRSWSRTGDRPNAGVYTRGSTVLHMLEVHLGRSAFDAGIRDYVATHAGGLVETQDLRRSLEDASGTSLGWVFDQWIHRGGVPSFDVKHRLEAKESPQVVVTITQKTEGTQWHAPVNVEIGTSDGVISRTVWVGPGKTELVADVHGEVEWVIADPQRGVLADWTQQQSPAEWRATATKSPHWDARLEAMSQLGTGHVDPDSLQTLADVVSQTSLDLDVRRHAISVLGDVKTSEGATHLRALINGGGPDVTAAVLGALGKQRSEPETLSLISAHLNDGDISVQIAALRAISTHNGPESLPLARKRLQADPDLARAALDVLGQHGVAKDLARILPLMDPKYDRAMRLSAARAAAKLVGRLEASDDTLSARFSRATEPLLDSDDQRIRSAAISLLKTGGDKRAALALQAFAHRTTLPKHAKRASDAAAVLRGGRPPAATPLMETDLERLEERLKALEDEVKDVKRWR